MNFFNRLLDKVLNEWITYPSTVLDVYKEITPSSIIDDGMSAYHIPFIYVAPIPEYGMDEEQLFIGKRNGYHNSIINRISHEEDAAAMVDPLAFIRGGPKLFKYRLLNGLYGGTTIRDSVGMEVDVNGGVGRIGIDFRSDSIARRMLGRDNTLTMPVIRDIIAESGLPNLVAFYPSIRTRRVDVANCNRKLLADGIISDSYLTVFNADPNPRSKRLVTRVNMSPVNPETVEAPVEEPVKKDEPIVTKSEPRITPSAKWGSELRKLSSIRSRDYPETALRMASESMRRRG